MIEVPVLAVLEVSVGRVASKEMAGLPLPMHTD